VLRTSADHARPDQDRNLVSDDQQGPNERNEPQPPAWGTEPGQPVQPTPYGEPVQPAPYGEPVQPAPYGQPGQYNQPLPYGPPQPATTDGMSIAALVTGIIGLGAVPVVLGILGLKRTKERGTSGRGLAIAGIVLGAVELAIGAVLVAIGLIAFLGLATMDSNSSSGSGDPTTVQSEAATPTTEDSLGADTSGTALRDIAPLEVAGFTTAGLVPDDVLVQAGALESYTASYTDGTSVVAAVLTDWTTEAEAQGWAATQNAAFTPDQLTDSGDDGNGITYQLYEVGDVTTVVATNYTAAFTLSGPYDAVVAIYQEYPL
jgi:hypothetical protein